MKPTKPPAKKGRPRKPTSSGLVDEDEPLVQPFRTTPDERPRSSEFDGGIDRPTGKKTNKTKKKTKNAVGQEGGSSATDVGGSSAIPSSATVDVGGSSSTPRQTNKRVRFSDVGGSSSTPRQTNLRGRGRGKGRGRGRVSTGLGRVGRLGRWFGIDENESSSDEEDEHAEEMPIDNQNAPHDSESQVSQNAATQNSQAIPSENQDAPHDSENPAVPDINAAQPRVRRHFVQPRQRGRSERILQKKLAKQQQGIGSSSSNALNLE